MLTLAVLRQSVVSSLTVHELHKEVKEARECALFDNEAELALLAFTFTLSLTLRLSKVFSLLVNVLSAILFRLSICLLLFHFSLLNKLKLYK